MVFDGAQRNSMVEIKLHHLGQCDMGSEQVSVFQPAGPVQEDGTQRSTVMCQADRIRRVVIRQIGGKVEDNLRVAMESLADLFVVDSPIVDPLQQG